MCPNEGKTIALSELKTNLLSEREDFKKRIAQAKTKEDAMSGRKSQLRGRTSQIRRGSYEKIMRRPSLALQASLAPSLGAVGIK